ncbi:hypothetical protein B5C34_07145 [Pacificimonas flava]|uniref:Uncharacterized protein n=2 Tax=Pacificimonas TaxID=1960290 RepID=A0A219B568_9SPHN|nr:MULTISPECIES: hypothetical protein [Pacificimonas]MBZ6379560.1 hypothetical protein [Pacificimonas aurantium]OWV33256.1 hypothetical protein B5C34_07145 [Pacificimonas flava]
MPEPARNGNVKWGRVGAVVGGVLIASLAWNAFDDDEGFNISIGDDDEVVAREITDSDIEEVEQIVERIVGSDRAEAVADRMREERSVQTRLEADGLTDAEREEFDEAFEEAMEALEEAREEIRSELESDGSQLSEEDRERLLQQLEL